MRYIDRTGKARNEKGESKNIRSLGDLSKEACKKAESKRLGVMKTSWGAYKVIRECGLGYEPEAFESLKAVDTYIKKI
jgi:hypothetical protein